MTASSVRIGILGGGFGGLYTALRLSQFPWQHVDGRPVTPEITLIDQHDRFVFLPLLYELVTGELQSWEIAPSFSELLANRNVRFQQAMVSQIDLANTCVQLQTGETLTFDHLVLALGGETPLDAVPGATDFAIPFRALQDAYRLEERLRSLETSAADKIRVAIVGAGYSGVELACKLAERLKQRGRIRLIELGSHILRNSPAFNQDAAQQALRHHQVWLDLETSVESIQTDSITLKYRGEVDTLPVDIVLWTVGNRMLPVIQTLAAQKNDRGQLLVSPALQLRDYPHVLALGDLAEGRDADGQPVPATAQVAFQQADYAAWNLWAMATGRTTLPFRYQPLGEMMTLGSENATLAGLGLQLDGPLAYLARRMIYLLRLPTLDHQLKVGLHWISRPILDVLGRD
jgi:demethylphylloquinone reductase